METKAFKLKVKGGALYGFERNGRHFLVSNRAKIYVLDSTCLEGLDDIRSIEAVSKVIEAGNSLTADDRRLVAGILRELHQIMPKNWFTRVAHRFGFYSYITHVELSHVESFERRLQETASVWHERRRRSFTLKDKTKVYLVEFRVIELTVYETKMVVA
jgi:hypothetical protein